MSSKHCRICYKPDQDDLISVRLTQDSLTIEEMILLITSIAVSSDRRLPQNICLQCLDRLKIAYNLRQQCIQTNDRLCAELQCIRVVEEQEQTKPESSTTSDDGENRDEIVSPSVVIEMIDNDSCGDVVWHELNKEPDQSESSIEDQYVAIEVINFRCCGCTMDFRSRKELEEHAIQQHRNGKRYFRGKVRPFICSTCYQTFPTQSMLDRHYEERNLNQQEATNEDLERTDSITELKERDDYVMEKQQIDEAEEGSLKHELDAIVIEIEPKANESQKSEEYILADSNAEDDELSINIEFSDAEEEEPDESEIDDELEEQTTIQPTERMEKANIQSAMCRIPGDNLSVVSQEQGYLIVEMQQHRCCCCAGLFSTVQELDQHLEKRNKNADLAHDCHVKYVCEYCGKQFTYWLVYICHKRMREQRQFYMCTLCNALLDSKKRMISHMLMSDEHANYFKLCRESIADRYEAIELPGTRCCCCKKYFDDDGERMDHIKRVHGLPLARSTLDKSAKPPYCCGVCGRRFRNERHMELHLQYTSDVTQYYCKQCEFQTYNPRRMELHLYSGIHRNSLPVSVQLKPLQNIIPKASRLRHCCFEECHTHFQNVSALKQHVSQSHQQTLEANRIQASRLNQILQSESYHECNVCSVLFKTLGALQAHQARRSRDDFVCAVCGVTKRTRTALHVHERTHTGERPFRCEYCDKTFLTNRTLISHRSCHITGQHTCDLCGHVFNRKENLNRHITLKHGEATIQCDVCPKKFKTTAVLNIHKLSHTGEKRFKCRTESCDKRYITVADRRRHEMSVHTLERPHKCSYCNAAFIRKRQLTIHERRHTGEKPFVCPVCGKDFVDRTPLRYHMRNVCNQTLIE
uniref:Protein krueppel n=1 Tax=Anopheles minimus TaxID=112268 RepID=A0A182VUN5_9DIPT